MIWTSNPQRRGGRPPRENGRHGRCTPICRLSTQPITSLKNISNTHTRLHVLCISRQSEKEECRFGAFANSLFQLQCCILQMIVRKKKLIMKYSTVEHDAMYCPKTSKQISNAAHYLLTLNGNDAFANWKKKWPGSFRQHQDRIWRRYVLSLLLLLVVVLLLLILPFSGGTNNNNIIINN